MSGDLATAKGGLTMAGGALSAYNAISQGKSTKRAAQQNAQVFEQQAANTRRAASLKEDVTRREAAQVIGNQLALGAQSGVALSGSRLDNLCYSYDNVERDAAAIRTDAAIQATGLENQARVERWQGDQAAKASLIGALGSGLSTMISLYGMQSSAKPEVSETEVSQDWLRIKDKPYDYRGGVNENGEWEIIKGKPYDFRGGVNENGEWEVIKGKPYDFRTGVNADGGWGLVSKTPVSKYSAVSELLAKKSYASMSKRLSSIKWKKSR